MKKSIFIVIALLSSALTYAQDESGILKDSINNIKRDFIQYIFADATLDTEDEAKSLAKDFLCDYVKIWCKKNDITIDIDSTFLSERTKYIIIRRGPQYKAFAYVAIQDIFGQTTGLDIEQRDVANAADSVVLVGEMPSAGVKLAQSEQTESTDQATLDNVGTYYSLVSKLYLCVTKEEVVSLVESDEFKGKCTYGDVTNKTSPDSISKGILVIYTKENHNVVAALGPRTPYRVNLKTLKADSTSNYPGCGAIWININEK